MGHVQKVGGEAEGEGVKRGGRREGDGVQGNAGGNEVKLVLGDRKIEKRDGMMVMTPMMTMMLILMERMVRPLKCSRAINQLVRIP